MRRDMKEALGTTRKPDTTHVRTGLRVYVARACEYGSDKYERANYLRPTTSFAEDVKRLRTYLRAAQDHIGKCLDDLEHAQALDPKITDVERFKLAAYSADTEAGGNFPASHLPHVAHAAASLNMAITQAIDAGLLPADPGTPWVTQVESPQTEIAFRTDPARPGGNR